LLSNRYFIISFLLGSISLSTGCLALEPANNITAPISWNDLGATPQAGGSLCWDISLLGDQPSWEQVKRDFGTGLIMKLDVADAKEVGFKTYENPSGMPLEAELHLWHGGENHRPVDIRFFAILDEQQLDIFPARQYYYDITLATGREMSIPLAIPSLSSGIHDLVIFGIPYLNEFPDPEGTVKILNYRITLVASPTTETFRQINFIELPAQGLLSRGAPKIPLMLGLSDNKLKAWNWPSRWLDIEADVVEFFVFSGYENTVNLDSPYLAEPHYSFFALTLFMDYRQINIDADVPVIYGKVGNDTAYASNVIKLNGLQRGMRHILAIKINYPGIPMCILHGPPYGRILPFGVDGILVGINALK